MEPRSTGLKGSDAEQQAFRYLCARGLKPVTRNFRYRGGEIDLIMLDGDCLSFIEVRYRSTTNFMRASHTVDHRKQAKIIRTAATFVARHRRFRNHIMRFDVVAVEGMDSLAIDWIADAFRPNDSTM